MNAYKIAVALSMQSNAAGVLSALSSQLLHVHAQVNQLQGALSRVKFAVGGAFGVAAGSALLKGMEKVVDRGNELVSIQQNMAQAGVKNVEIQEAYNKAWELTNKYKNVSAAEALKVINEGRMTFGSQHEATHHSEDFIKMISFLKAYQGGKHGAGASEFEREAVAAMKSGEIAGKVSPEEMSEHVKQLTAMRVAYGDQLKIQQYLTAQRAGGVALRNTSDEFRYGMFPALVQENGSSAGVMLMTAFNKIVAGTGNRTKSVEHMAELGLLQKDQIEYDKNGRVKGLKDPSAIMNNREAAMNFGSWVMSTLKPKLDAQTTDPIRQAQLISAMFPDRNAAKAITEIVQQFNKLTKDAKLMAEARAKMNEAAYLDKSWQGQKQAFEEQWNNLVAALGAPMVGRATEMLRQFNESLGGMSQWAAKPENADTIRAIGVGIAGLGASLVGAGAAAILAALGPAGWLVLGIGALGTAAEAYKPGYLLQVGQDIKAFWTAIANFDVKAIFTTMITGLNDLLMGLPAQIGTKITELTPGIVNSVSGIATAIGNEISSWPGKLMGVISGMGSAIVNAIKAALQNAIGNNGQGGTGNPMGDFQPGSFSGGGSGGAKVQKTSYGGSGDDSVANAAGLGGRGRGGAGGPMPGIPSSVGMTENERNTLGLIQKYESGGRNVMNYIGDSRHTAQGYYQLTNTNWRRIAPQLGISAPNARAASLEDQTRVAHHLLRHGGVQNWSNFNPSLRGALRRGERAPRTDSGAAASPAPSPAKPSVIPPPKPAYQPAGQTVVMLDGRIVGKMVEHRMIASANTRNGIGGFDDSTMKTAVGHPGAVFA